MLDRRAGKATGLLTCSKVQISGDYLVNSSFKLLSMVGGGWWFKSVKANSA